jgi:hypothetical protein
MLLLDVLYDISQPPVVTVLLLPALHCGPTCLDGD